MELVRFELYKLYRRKDAAIIYTMILIALLYSLGFANNLSNISYHGDHNMTGLDFAGDMFIFGYYIFIFLISSGLSMINSCRGEIIDGSIALVINRVGDRKKVYLSKVLAHFIYMAIFTLIFIIFSIICYLLFLKDLEISSGYIFTGKDVESLISIFSVMLIYFFAITLSGLISTRFNVIGSAGIFIVIWAIFMFINEFDGIKNISPIYHLNKTIDSPNISNFILYLACVCAYILLTSLLAALIFEKSDLD